MKYRYLDIVTGLFVAVFLISNVASTKIIALGPFSFDGGTVLFPLSYIFGDILTEVYGYQRSRRVIWTGLISNLLMAGFFSLIGWLPADPEWSHQEAYQAILLYTPRIIAASTTAYFVGEFANSYVLSKMKITSGGRHLWQRALGSTVVGQLLDTGVFTIIAFYGAFSNALLFSIFISNYIFKIGLEVVNMPLTYLVVNKLKILEKVDAFDYGVDYNPFRLKEEEKE